MDERLSVRGQFEDTLEKSHTNAANVTLHSLMQVR